MVCTPFFTAQQMGGIMATIIFAAIESVQRAGEHVHEPGLCDDEVFTKSGEGHCHCEHADSTTSCA